MVDTGSTRVLKLSLERSSWHPSHDTADVNFQSVQGAAHHRLTTAPFGHGFLPSPYHQPWWLDIVSDGKWKQITHKEGDRVVGWLPYVEATKLGFSLSRMPPGLPFLGPAIWVDAKNEDARFRKSTAIIRALVQELPRFSCFSQKMHRGIDNAVPFQMEGFATGVQFTFEVSGDPAHVWKGMRRRTREVITSAQRRFRVSKDIQADEFIPFMSENHLAAFGAPMIGLSVFEALARESIKRGCGCAFAGRDQRGALAAFVFCVSDHCSTHYFLSSRRKDSGNAVVSLLLWHAIQDALARETIFDFSGLGDAGSVSFFSGFTSCLRPRYIATKTTLPFRAMREIRRLSGPPDNHFTSCL